MLRKVRRSALTTANISELHSSECLNSIAIDRLSAALTRTHHAAVLGSDATYTAQFLPLWAQPLPIGGRYNAFRQLASSDRGRFLLPHRGLRPLTATMRQDPDRA